MSDIPLLVKWNGAAFVPANPVMLKRAAEGYEVDGVYRIEFKEERSEKAHQAFFASVVAAWKTLPEDLSARYPTPDHMRYKALIINGYADEYDIPCASGDVAKTVAQNMRKLLNYAVIIPRGDVVKVYVAQSQKMLRSGRGMDKKTFHQSADAVLATVAEWANTTPAELRRHAQDDGTERMRNQIDVDPPSRDSPKATKQTSVKTSAPAASGASPASAITPELPVTGGASPEEKSGGGGELMPRNYRELVDYTKAWLGFVAGKRIAERLERERRVLWPTMDPPLTAGQHNHLESLVEDKLARL